MNSKQKEKKSINIIEIITMEKLNSFWQTFDQQNDQAIDGIIYLGKKNHKTGQFVYVQAKTGESYIYKENNLEIILKFTTKELAAWRSIWNNTIEPVIMIYCNKEGKCYWTNLKDESSFLLKTRIKIQKNRAYNEKTKSVLVRMCGSRIHDRNLPILQCRKKDRPYLYTRTELKEAAKKYYNNLKTPNSINYENKYFQDLKFSRLGWNHINNRKRTIVRIRQSLELLGTVKLILENVSKYDQLKVFPIKNGISEYLSIKALIEFDNRAKGIIQVIIVRKREFQSDGTYTEKKWFLSVHEIIKKD
jgi:hypothetical protein